MTLADIRIIILFCLIVGFFVIFSAVFGIRGTYILYYLSGAIIALFVIFSLISNGKL